MKNYKSLISMCIFAALANCGKSDVVGARELPNGRVLVNNPTAIIGSEEKHVKTPYMIVAPDGKSGFANDFMTNAISIVSEDCTNYYVHIQNENGDRTKVIHFTVDKNGIPSKTGDIIDTVNSGETSNATKMRKRKLVGVKNGHLFFFAVGKYDSCLIYNPKTGAMRTETRKSQQTGLQEPQKLRYFGSYQNDSDLYILTNYISTDTWGNSHTNGQCQIAQNDSTLYGRYGMAAVKNNNIFTVINDSNHDGTFYSADSKGNIYKGFTSNSIAKLPGAISSLSNNGDEVFATSTATNAFYNVTLKNYNVVKDVNGNPKPMVPRTNEGLLRVIDNRKKNGKFLYVTPSGVHSIE